MQRPPPTATFAFHGLMAPPVRRVSLRPAGVCRQRIIGRTSATSVRVFGEPTPSAASLDNEEAEEAHAFLDLAGLDQAARAADGGDGVGYSQTISVEGGPDGSVFHESAKFGMYITSEALQSSLARMRFDKVTVVQAAAIPQIQSGRDAVIQSHTGSGKTLAYLLPLLQRLQDEDENENDDPEFRSVRVVIAAPTRELAMQISRECQALMRAASGQGDKDDPTATTAVLPIIGGANTGRQIEKLKKVRPSVIVGTPGRLLELARGTRPALRLRKMFALVIDEVDHALAPAFRNELEALVAVCPKKKQTVLVSATASRPLVRDFAVQTMKDPVLLQVDSKRSLPASISHYYTLTPRQKKLDAIRRIMYTEPVPRVAICFVDDQRRAYIVAEKMEEFGINVVALTGDADKVERANVLQATRRGEVSLLISTEVAARGIDLPSLTHVINLNLPTDADHYIHRAGRCGRVGVPGTVISIVRPEMQFVMEKITKPLGINPRPIQLKGGKLVAPRSTPSRSADKRDKSATTTEKAGLKRQGPPRQKGGDSPHTTAAARPAGQYDRPTGVGESRYQKGRTFPRQQDEEYPSKDRSSRVQRSRNISVSTSGDKYQKNQERTTRDTSRMEDSRSRARGATSKAYQKRPDFARQEGDNNRPHTSTGEPRRIRKSTTAAAEQRDPRRPSLQDEDEYPMARAPSASRTRRPRSLRRRAEREKWVGNRSEETS